MDKTAGKLFGLFSSDKDKLPSSLIIPVDDTLRPGVFPSVDCSPGDEEVEVVHLRGVNKCRKRGRTRGKESDSSDKTSGKQSSPESGYRSVAEGVLSTPVASSDVSNDSLVSVSSCPSSVVTSPILSVSNKSSDVPTEVFSQAIELPTEMSSIITRTAAEDDLIRSILDDHCMSLCPPAVSDDSLTSVLADASKYISTDADVPTLNGDVSETGLPASQCDSVKENTQEKSDDIGLQKGKENSEELDKVVSVDETVSAACEPSVVEDEISIYDDGRLAVQHGLVHETSDESLAGISDSGLDLKQQPGCFEPVSPFRFTDTESPVSDTKLSRTSSMSSALSLESLVAHSAEVR